MACRATPPGITTSHRRAAPIGPRNPYSRQNMSRYWSAVVHGLTPYGPGEQPKLDDLVKLNTNEHPY